MDFLIGLVSGFIHMSVAGDRLPKMEVVEGVVTRINERCVTVAPDPITHTVIINNISGVSVHPYGSEPGVEIYCTHD